MLSEYAKGQFKQGFGFDYAGDHSEPPDRHGDRVKGFAELFQTQRHPPPEKDVEAWLDAEVFRKGSRTFPDYANDVIWTDIRDTAIGCITESCTREDWWFHTRKQRVYENPSGNVNMKHYGIYVYACGEIAYQGVQVHRMFVYYLGVFCGVSK
ncbi:hypothetical protein P691DRAFT_148528 [Macrolepiota fuliginosa MF-IS2]|uniref:Uncharacterized protein n=1 Tax=Macrolepiota fuliginosa MF-IS2 TaxID=1400762 RepID=A0A9P5XLA8_9AGAR|nr:hypothetical protein P691DRAFT_148528 [Macrolepiota fuliginosa MF-IS2]